jgi:hypothetical protein
LRRGGYLLHEGEAVFVNANVLHKLKRGQKGVPCRINSLLFAPEFVSGFPQSIIQQRYIAPLTRCGPLAEVLLRPGVPWQKKRSCIFKAPFPRLSATGSAMRSLFRSS